MSYHGLTAHFAGVDTILPRDDWERRAAAHAARADDWIRPHLERRSRGEKHPIWDFLFDYYSIRPTHITRWHPGLGVGLADAAGAPQAAWRDYRVVDKQGADVVAVDVESFLAHRRADMEAILVLLTAMERNRPQFDCFGLHEWAMVYQTREPRHDLPLRLGQAGTDAVVEAHPLRCTHFDAYRFFTPPARPLNLTVLHNDDRPMNEQCACLHAGMDLFKWSFKMGPLVPGELLLDCFELARDIRRTDMEASPYDCRELGFGVVDIETPAGKAEYVARQRSFSARAQPLRRELVAILERALTR